MPRKPYTVNREPGEIHGKTCSGFSPAQRAYLDQLLDERFCRLRESIREDTEKTLHAVLLEGTRLLMLRDLTGDVPLPPQS